MLNKSIILSKKESRGLDAIYEDYIISLVGARRLHVLRKYKLVESCGSINGRPLYTLCAQNN